MHGETVKCN